MRRLSEKHLDNWIKRQELRKVLLLRGARQVGKSTLVRQFAANQGLDLIEVNVEQRPLQSLKSEAFSVADILQEMELLNKKRLTPKSLLFFDEVQAQPKLLQGLRYFYEERQDIPVIAAGSLLDFTLSDKAFSMPVGRIEYHNLGPMSFLEVLWAMGESALSEILEDMSLDKETRISPAVHEHFVSWYRKYLFVGGMPEAVLVYQRTQSPEECRRVHAALLQTYQDDFSKYSRMAQSRRVRKVFQSAPAHLGQKVIYSKFDRDEKSRDIKEAVDLLIKAKILIPVYHSNASGLPLRAQVDDSVYKLYFLDVGLVNAAMGVGWESLCSGAESSLLSKGMIAEQFVAQHLFYSPKNILDPELFYWLRDKKSRNAEVDFLISREEQILPIEVKSGKVGRLKSLNVFMEEKQFPLALRCDLSLPKKEKIKRPLAAFDLLNWPIYAVERL